MAPKVSISTSASSVNPGSSAQIVWDTEGVTSCTASGDWTGTRLTNGVLNVIPQQPTNTYALTCNGPNGGATASANISLIAQGAVSVDLKSDVSVTPIGGDTILSWTSKGAANCTGSGAWSGAKSLRGAEVLRGLKSNASFSIQCTGPGGNSTDTALVEVRPAPIIELTAAPAAAYVGDKTELQWNAQYADTCMATGDWSGARPTSGTESSKVLDVNATFTLTCAGISGSVSKSVSVTVTPPPDPSLTLTSLTPSVPSGSYGMLRWQGIRVSNCQASGGWSGARDSSGSEPVGPLTTNQTYTLECSGTGGPFTKTASMSVIAAPPAPTTVSLISADFVELIGREGHEGYLTVNDQPVLRGEPLSMKVELAGPVSTVNFSLIDTQGQKIADATLDAIAATARPGDFLGEVSPPTRRPPRAMAAPKTEIHSM